MGVFLYDLRRATRSGRPALLRVGYALILLAALGGLFARRFPAASTLDPQIVPHTVGAALMGRFAADFVAVCAIVQFGAVLLLTPAATAGAVAAERQRGTLDLLLTTELSAGAIVLGKFAARTVHLFALLLTGLPVLALAQLWGGVGPAFVAAGFVINAATLASLGALGLFCSAQARTVPGAAVATYALAGLFGVLTAWVPGLRYVNPAALYGAWLADPDGAGIGGWLGPALAYAAFHLTAAAVLVAAAARSLRERPVDIERSIRAAAAGRPLTGLSGDLAALARAAAPFLRQPVESLLPRAAAVRVFPPPPVGRDPLLWKELHFGGSATAGELFRSAGCLIVLLELLATAPLALMMAQAPSPGMVAREMRPFYASLVVALTGALCLGVAVTAAGSVSHERERRTLDGLLTLPDGRAAVLEAKWLGSLLRVRWLAAGLLPAWGLVMLTDGLTRVSFLVLVASGLVHVGFCACLGVWVSVWARGSGQAAVAVVLILIGLSVVPPLASGAVASLIAPHLRAPPDRVAERIEEALSPPLTWWRLAYHRGRIDAAALGARLEAVLHGLLGYGVAALLLMGLAYRRFGREDRHERRP
jgi:ABC-type transport system involved in multi-copper enzyme maturation permease subunit